MKIKKVIIAILIFLIVLLPFETNAQKFNDYEYLYNVENGVVTLTKYVGNETDVIIPEKINGYTVTKLTKTFAYNTSIESVDIPDTVTHIGNDVFYKCVNLKKVKFSKNLEYIGSYALRETNIRSIVLPKKLHFIRSYAFYGCENLKYLKLTSQNISLSNYAFYNTNLKTIQKRNTKINVVLYSLPDGVLYTHNAFESFLLKGNLIRQIYKIDSYLIRTIYILLYALCLIFVIIASAFLLLKVIRIIQGNQEKKYQLYVKQYEEYIVQNQNITNNYYSKSKKVLLLLLVIAIIVIWFYLFAYLWFNVKSLLKFFNYPINYITYIILFLVLSAVLLTLLSKIILKIRLRRTIRVKKR